MDDDRCNALPQVTFRTGGDVDSHSKKIQPAETTAIVGESLTPLVAEGDANNFTRIHGICAATEQQQMPNQFTQQQLNAALLPIANGEGQAMGVLLGSKSNLHPPASAVHPLSVTETQEPAKSNPTQSRRRRLTRVQAGNRASITKLQKDAFTGEIIKVLGALGFSYANATSKRIYELSVGEDRIVVDLETFKISYPSATVRGRDTCLNLMTETQILRENLVTLECYVRLIRQGYSAAQIELERSYPLGHNEGGWADIVVKQDGSPGVHRPGAFEIIEVKAPEEFDAAAEKLELDGGQLFTYFHNDKTASFLALYTSSLDRDTIVGQWRVIACGAQDFRDAPSSHETFAAWDKTFLDDDLFSRPPYGSTIKAKLSAQLDDLTQGKQSQTLFIDLLEILRKHAISDKSNAFNKIINLFVAKIQDEMSADKPFDIVDASGNTIHQIGLHFQFVDGVDTDASFQLRLGALYRNGMGVHLDKTVVDFDDDAFSRLVDALPPLYRVNFQRMHASIRDFRLKRGGDFAFIDVYDDITYRENAKILRAVVKCLQKWRFTYDRRHQLLGDFFEHLLNTSMKQEAGQFFTPMPMVQFICECLPFEEMIRGLLSTGGRPSFIPKVIDHACGSGHFLIYAMDVIHDAMTRIHDDKIFLAGLHAKLPRSLYGQIEDQYAWADRSIFGIEKDHRLVKATKISCFLNGDGKANIIHGDGLDDFSTSLAYKGLIQAQQFDVVVSNPPYSVDGFRSIVSGMNGAENFTLLDGFTEESSEIEALFIERTAHLLKAGGIAALVLPSNVLNNSQYVSTRRFMLKHFHFMSIAKFGSSTFAATTTCPIVLFLRKKSAEDIAAYDAIAKMVRESLMAGDDRTIGKIPAPIQSYIDHIGATISFESYSKAWANTNNHKSLPDGFNFGAFPDLDFAVNDNPEKDPDARSEAACAYMRDEVERITLFLTLLGNKVLILTAPNGIKEENKFLGYSFSSGRGKQGISVNKGADGLIKTPLFNDSDHSDPSKISTVIRHWISTSNLDISKMEAGTASLLSCIDMIDAIVWDDPQISYSLEIRAIDLPIDRPWIELRTIAEVQPEPTKGEYVPDIYINIGCIKDGRIIPGAGEKRDEGRVARYGDVLIPMVDPKLDKIAILDEVGKSYRVAQALCIVRFDNPALGFAFHKYARSNANYFFDQITVKKKGFKESYAKITARHVKRLRVLEDDIRLLAGLAPRLEAWTINDMSQTFEAVPGVKGFRACVAPAGDGSWSWWSAIPDHAPDDIVPPARRSGRATTEGEAVKAATTAAISIYNEGIGTITTSVAQNDEGTDDPATAVGSPNQSAY